MSIVAASDCRNAVRCLAVASGRTCGRLSARGACTRMAGIGRPVERVTGMLVVGLQFPVAVMGMVGVVSGGGLCCIF